MKRGNQLIFKAFLIVLVSINILSNVKTNIFDNSTISIYVACEYASKDALNEKKSNKGGGGCCCRGKKGASAPKEEETDKVVKKDFSQSDDHKNNENLAPILLKNNISAGESSVVSVTMNTSVNNDNTDDDNECNENKSQVENLEDASKKKESADLHTNNTNNETKKTGGCRGILVNKSYDNDENKSFFEKKNNLSESDSTLIQASSCCKKTKSEHTPAIGNKTSCCGVMPMSFQYGTHTVILFKQWETTSPWQFYLAVLAWFILGLLSIALKVFRNIIEPKLCLFTLSAVPGFCVCDMRGKNNNIDNNNNMHDYNINNDIYKSSMNNINNNENENINKFPIKGNMIRSLIATFIYAYDYLLMLVVMTFNMYLFIAVCLGLGFGVFLFGHISVEKKKNKNYNLNNPQTICENSGNHFDLACCGT